ncbi:MAG: hypothetical protein SF029_24070, partial [bacterium]|nr:hypothetical protein [bacterium]
QDDEPPLSAPLLATTPAAMDRIIVYDLSGGRRELVFGTGEHHIWGFSPDGCRVLFSLSETGGLPQIYTARLNGDDVRPLVRYDETTFAIPDGQWGTWEPAWSPDGSRIAFVLIRGIADELDPEAQDHHIAWIPGDSDSALVPQFYSVTGREFSPQWSPDSAWLAYVSYDERPAGADAQSTAVPTVEPIAGQPTPATPMIQEADLWVVSADGETKYRLTTFETGNVRHPRWSPDGALIGFIHSPSANNDTFWMIANQQGAIPTQLSYLWNLTLDHTWLPDSSAMLAAVRDFRETTENQLWRIPLIGNADNDATLYLAQTFPHTDYARFSPDGRYLAFRSDYVLTLADLQAGTYTALDADLPGNTPPVWSPAGYTGEAGCNAG